MTKHYDRKTLCDIKYVSDQYMTPKEYYDLSVKKRYFFDTKLPTFIANSTYIKLIKEYNDDINYIDFFGPSLDARNSTGSTHIGDLSQSLTRMGSNQSDDSLLPSGDLRSPKKVVSLLIDSFSPLLDNWPPPAVEMSLQHSEDLQNPSALSGQDGHPKKVDNWPPPTVDMSLQLANPSVVKDHQTHSYECYNCKKVFKKKDSYIHHLQHGGKLCEKLTIMNISHKKREEAEQAKMIIQNIYQNINQTQNVQNIQNNNNQIQNDNHNNIDLSLRDFAKEGYSIDHINVSDLKDDFYLYDNMAELVFQNDVNKNVFFQDKVAIVYTSNRIDVLPTDKAVFHIHTKIGRAADRLVEKHSPAKRKGLQNVVDYYRINSNKFCHDTLYKKYDVKEKCYVHDSDVLPGLRTRDECISNVVGIVNAHEERTQEIFRAKGLNTKKLPPVNPVTIEYFANVKDRYKPLKEDD